MRISQIISSFTKLGLLLIITFSLLSCSKNLPDRIVAYSNDFENANTKDFKIFGATGLENSLKIIDFNKTKIFGRFSGNGVIFTYNQLPEHNVIKIEFDLYIHDDWKGNFIAPGTTIPDLWQLKLDNNPLLVTNFSNGVQDQLFPNDYSPTLTNNKAFSNSWAVLPGICSKVGQSNGTSFYKIEYITSHSGPIELVFQDISFSSTSLCIKSWSIDNLKLTTMLKQ